MPKLPPMSPHTTRILLSGTFSTLLRQLGLEHVGALQGRVDGVAAFDRLVEADAAARLHGRGGDAVDDEMMFDDVRGVGEGGVGRLLVAFDLDEADVVRAIVPDQSGTPGFTASPVETIAGSGS